MATPLELLGAMARFAQLARSQYWSEGRHQAHRRQRLERSLAAADEIPFYQDRLATWRAGEDLQSLPVLRRAELPALCASVRSLPARGAFTSARSSGSTGRPVELLFDAAHQRGRFGAWARCLTANGWNPARRNALIIHLTEERRRGLMLRWFSRLGCQFRSLFTNYDAQRRWLLELDPLFLITLPSNLEGLLDSFEGHHQQPRSLRRVFCAGEHLGPDLRQQVRDQWGVEIVDLYGAIEATIAWQCPAGSYHVNAEHLILELLDDQDCPVAAGQLGRVVITTLENELMPLIRYEIGDVAMAASGCCSCGRTLPLIGGIAGRSLNLFRATDGRLISPWELVVSIKYRADIDQLQIVQRGARAWQLRYVASQPLSPTAEAEIRRAFSEVLGAGGAIGFDHVTAIDRTAAGKYMTALNQWDPSNEGYPS